MVIGVDAVSWAVLAVSYARIAPLAARLSSAQAAVPDPAEPNPAEPDPAQPDPPAAVPLPSGWSVIRPSPVLPGLLALSFVFYLLYGPVEVALPVHVATDLHGSAALLGTFWAVFGVGAVIGELAAPYLRRWPVWPVMTGIVLGWGLALVPLGLDTPLWAGLAAFFAGAVIWGPWFSLSMAVLQDASPPDALAQVIAARFAAHPRRAAGHRAGRTDRGRPRRSRHPARFRAGHSRAGGDHRGFPGRAAAPFAAAGVAPPRTARPPGRGMRPGGFRGSRLLTR